MLQYEQDGAMQTLDWDRYYIQQEWNGAENTLHLTIPVRHPQMLSLAERMQLRESGDGLIYRVSKYDRGTSNLDLEAELDLDELCGPVLLGWDNRANDGGTAWMTLGATVAAMLDGTGWTLDDQSARTDVQQMETFSGTVLEGITQAVEVWGNDLGVQYDNAARVVHLYSPGQRQPTGAYLTEDLNLLEAPQVRGKAARGEYYNRLYLIGADGLTLPSPYYVENRAGNEPVVSHVETNEDISDTATLQSTAAQMVAEASTVARSYTCKVADLYRLRPAEYAHLKIDLYDTVILIDRADYSRSYRQVSRFKRWPACPEKNEVTLDTVPGTLSATAGTTYSVARDAAPPGLQRPEGRQRCQQGGHRLHQGQRRPGDGQPARRRGQCGDGVGRSGISGHPQPAPPCGPTATSSRVRPARRISPPRPSAWTCPAIRRC